MTTAGCIERAAAVSAASAVTPVSVETADTTERETAAAPAEQKEEMPETEETKQEGLHAEILKLKKLGMTEVQIAKKLGIRAVKFTPGQWALQRRE